MKGFEIRKIVDSFPELSVQLLDPLHYLRSRYDSRSLVRIRIRAYIYIYIYMQRIFNFV